MPSLKHTSSHFSLSLLSLSVRDMFDAAKNDHVSAGDDARQLCRGRADVSITSQLGAPDVTYSRRRP